MKNKRWKKSGYDTAHFWDYFDKKSGFHFSICFDALEVEVASWLKGSDEDFYLETFKIQDKTCDIKTFEKDYLANYQKFLLDETKKKLTKIIESL